MKIQKTIIVIIAVCLAFFLVGCTPQDTQTPQQSAPPEQSTPPEPDTSGTAQIPDEQDDVSEATEEIFKISSSGIMDGVIADKYGMRGSQLAKNGIPTLSLPVKIENAPKGTACFVVVMTDPDSEPLCGYTWVHWLAVFDDQMLPEGASIDMADKLLQGKNDFQDIGYGGPTPPDKTHTYVITVYALDTMAKLENGFAKAELPDAIDGHVLAEAEIKASYSNK